MKSALDTAKAYLDKLPAAISGAGGHAATFAAACWTVRLGLPDSDALALLLDYNRRCQPPWKEAELVHKLKDARRVAGCQVRTFQPRPAVRTIWKLERKAVRVAEPVAIQAPSAPAPAPTPAPAEPQRPALPNPEAAAWLPPDCLPWLHVARQVLEGEWNNANRSEVESLTIGLRGIQHPTCREALARLQTYSKT